MCICVYIYIYLYKDKQIDGQIDRPILRMRSFTTARGSLGLSHDLGCNGYQNLPLFDKSLDQDPITIPRADLHLQGQGRIAVMSLPDGSIGILRRQHIEFIGRRGTERVRDRERQRQTDRQRQRETERDKERQRETERDRERERQRERERERLRQSERE